MSEIEVKSLIVESATRTFSKFGFYKTTMNEIARHIHKAKGVLYYYYKSKEDLFNEVLKQELNIVKVELNKIVDNEEDSLVILKTYILSRLKLLSKSINYRETLKADFFEKYIFVKGVKDDFDVFERAKLTLILGKGKNQGYLDVQDINSAVNILMMIMNGIEIPLFLQNKYSEYENTIDELSTMLVKSLKVQKN
ncbi:MAG: helix-turn-helix domain-containing protein [Bacteroidales bacterium]